jgi:hypothetical protein
MFPKTGKKFPGGNDPENGRARYPAIIARALTAELGDTHQAAKIVMRWTGASERAVKHWLAGTHGPSGGHLLVLMQESVAVFESVLTAAGRRDAVVAVRILAAQGKVMDVIARVERERTTPQPAGTVPLGPDNSGPAFGRNDSENDSVRESDYERESGRLRLGKSPRQAWFLEALRGGNAVRVTDLRRRWGVSEATARRDVAELKAKGRIEFVGSCRSGSYRLTR